jgi:hypothetical protein
MRIFFLLEVFCVAGGVDSETFVWVTGLAMLTGSTFV